MPQPRELNHTVDWTVHNHRLVLPLFEHVNALQQAQGIDTTPVTRVLKSAQSPASLKGFVYLEVGSGQNDIAAILRSRGARAYAVDPEYANPKKLDKSITDWVATQTSTIGPRTLGELKLSRERFRQDFKRNPKFYITGYSTDLSQIPDNSVDLALSHFCISPVVSPHPEELISSLDQLIRKLKPAVGVALIFPFDNREDLYYGKYEEARKHAQSLDQARSYLNETVPGTWQEYSCPQDSPLPLNERGLLVIRKSPNLP